MQFGTLRVYVIHEEFSALNFTSVNVAKLSSQTLRKSSSFRTLRRLHQLAKLSTTLHGVQFIHGFTTTLVMHQARLMLPLRLQSFSGVNRVWPFFENSEFLCTYVRPSAILILRIWIRWNSFFKSSSDRPKVAKLSSRMLRVLR